ncbi:urease accessory protein UreD [Thauera linaloolentis]|uniref:urease accessory protein UreD n=1 Tax=Thauera linaloolentis TaxID=76112 RepID=UPI0004914A2D|nr:urease accessory protein UreD [Thauera linaloolentis]MCM8566768.1 urease accessory protein UreD [Thauera linaloolentis]
MNGPADHLHARASAAASAPRGGWRAALSLAYERRGGRTVLARREHVGPLVVQRPLYPEGGEVCHTILVHPPAGIAGGDSLSVDLRLGEGAQVLVTTPGAGKWYRSAGRPGALAQRIEVGAGGVCEWLPQESIVYDGALGELSTEVRLQGDACFVGTEMLCFGRTASGECFRHGELAMRTRIARDGRPLWLERGVLAGGNALLDAAVGMRGCPVSGSFVVASPRCDAALLEAWRGIASEAGEGAATLLPGLLLARWLGPACEPGRAWFARLWAAARPVVAGRAAHTPRIWNT